MTWYVILLIVIGGFILVLGVGSLIYGLYFFSNVAPRISKPLEEKDVLICAKIVQMRKGYPYICRWATRNKACPCLPCKKLDEAKLEG